jgi:hypothetical protein
VSWSTTVVEVCGGMGLGPAGEVLDAAFIYLEVGADPVTDRTEMTHPGARTYSAPVPTAAVVAVGDGRVSLASV